MNSLTTRDVGDDHHGRSLPGAQVQGHRPAQQGVHRPTPADAAATDDHESCPDVVGQLRQHGRRIPQQALHPYIQRTGIGTGICVVNELGAQPTDTSLNLSDFRRRRIIDQRSGVRIHRGDHLRPVLAYTFHDPGGIAVRHDQRHPESPAQGHRLGQDPHRSGGSEPHDDGPSLCHSRHPNTNPPAAATTLARRVAALYATAAAPARACANLNVSTVAVLNVV